VPCMRTVQSRHCSQIREMRASLVHSTPVHTQTGGVGSSTHPVILLAWVNASQLVTESLRDRRMSSIFFGGVVVVGRVGEGRGLGRSLSERESIQGWV
jgi:hypothetical protein